jgi:hypothetical protein
VGGVVDGKVTKDEFINYYGNVSSSIDNDEYFELMITRAWNLSDSITIASPPFTAKHRVADNTPTSEQKSPTNRTFLSTFSLGNEATASSHEFSAKDILKKAASPAMRNGQGQDANLSIVKATSARYDTLTTCIVALFCLYR